MNSQCRACGHQLESVSSILDLGSQSPSSVYPQNQNEELGSFPLELVKCPDCNLVQLRHTVSPELLYTDYYGYRSGINETMVKHLHEAAAYAMTFSSEDKEYKRVLEIGCNDGTMLRKLEELGCKGIDGIDLCATQFLEHYEANWNIQVGAFPEQAANSIYDIIVSFSVLYDIDDLRSFFLGIRDRLDEDCGIWITEQSYLPSMLQTCSFDTIVHEHIEYYTLKPLLRLADKSDLKLVDASLNSCNGGSIRLAFACKSSKHTQSSYVNDLLKYDELFNDELEFHFESIRTHLEVSRKHYARLLSRGSVSAIGASTKGNTFLQFVGASPSHIHYVVDRNPTKVGRYTPATNIPIVGEDILDKKPTDFGIVLPWHFRDSIIKRSKRYLVNGGTLVFFYPHYHEVTAIDL